MTDPKPSGRDDAHDDRQWEVTLRCVVTKRVICEDCTEEEARREPFEFAVDETEVEQVDWEVLSVEDCK